MKIFRSNGTKQLIEQLGRTFRQVSQFKPEASRKESAEIYLIAMSKKTLIKKG